MVTTRRETIMHRVGWIGILALGAALLSGSTQAASGCGTVLVKTGVAVSGPSVSASVSNPTSRPASGYLWIEAKLVDGSRAVASVPVSVPPNSSTTGGASFPVNVELVADTGVCAYPPGGISETPDPVVILIPPHESEDDGSGSEGGGEQ
jgi:hypothetical protein